MLKSLTTAFFTLALGLQLPGSVAASEICDSLSNQLTNLSDTIASPTQVRKYGRAIAAQKLNIRALNAQIRETNCSSGSVIVIGGDNEDECSILESKLLRMERNLDILEEKRLNLMTGASDDAKRQDLLASLETYGCNQQPIVASVTVEETVQQPTISETSSGVETIRVPTSEIDYSKSQFIDLGGTANNGTYRTMCVRACDGAYFPVSSHASTQNFQRDAQVCSMMCPGMETELYYHSINAESADMRSATSGQPYDTLANAYAFRTRKPEKGAECGCNFSLYYKEMMKRQAFVKNPDQQPSQESAITWIKPELRGKIDVKPSDLAVSVKHRERDYKPGGQIRVIGPQFLPDNSELDFTKPVESAAQ